MTTTTNSPSKASSGTVESTDKRSKLGFVPDAKLSTIVGPKVLADYRKRAAELSEARDALSKMKSDMTAAICKKLNLGDPATVDVSVQEDKAVLFRRPSEKPRQQPKSAMVDLTA